MKQVRVPYIVALGFFSSILRIAESDNKLKLPMICGTDDLSRKPEPMYLCMRSLEKTWGTWTFPELSSKIIEGESTNTNFPELQVESFGLFILSFTSKVDKEDEKSFTIYVSSTPNTWRIQADVFHYNKDKQTDKFALISAVCVVGIEADSRETILPMPLLQLEEGNTNDLILELSGLQLKVKRDEVHFEDANKILLGIVVLKQLTFKMSREHTDGVEKHKLTLKGFDPLQRNSLQEARAIFFGKK